jgi:hypothetical protein
MGCIFIFIQVNVAQKEEFSLWIYFIRNADLGLNKNYLKLI